MLVHTEITVLQPSDLQVIRQLPCTGIWKPMLLTMRLFTRNVQASGAYRGYGATQGIYAVKSAVNEPSP